MHLLVKWCQYNVKATSLVRWVRKWKTGIFLTLVFYSLIVVYILSEKLNKIQHLNDFANSTKKPNQINISVYCEEYGEWELLDKGYFFKRSATYYLIDGHFFRLNLIKRSNLDPVKFNFYLKISFISEEYSLYHTIESTIMQSRWKVKEYELIYIDAKFNIYQFLNTRKIKNFEYDTLANKISIQIQVEVEQTGKSSIRSKSNLTAKIKYLKKNVSEKLKNALVCSKCLYTHKDEHDSKKLEWWIEVNREAGYDGNCFFDF
jgi:hypothetical protein